jgi:hypothetical protein
VAGTVSTASADSEVAYLRSVGTAVRGMAADAERRLREFEEAERFERVFGWAHLGFAGVAEGVSETLKEAERWIPGHWEAGEWIEGFWKVETETLRAVGEGVEVEAGVLRAVHVPGHFGPRSWVAGEEVASGGLRTAGKALGIGAAALDVGLAGWEDWGKHGDLHGAERAGHAAWTAATIGGGSAAGTYFGYVVGAAAVGALVGLSPVLAPAAGAIAVVGGIGGAMIGSEFGHRAGKFGKELVEKGGKGLVSGAKKIAGWFS